MQCHNYNYYNWIFSTFFFKKDELIIENKLSHALSLNCKLLVVKLEHTSFFMNYLFF